MRYQKIGTSSLEASVVALGCMGFGGGWGTQDISAEEDKRNEAAFLTALDVGINLFDHADIYGGNGKAERAFSRLLKLRGGLRDKIILQSKCGIRPGMYDFSKEHILRSVEGSLSRLGTDYLDILLLHRPDTLVEYEEVAAAFDLLYRTGKVRFFGVSNHSASQISAMQKYVGQPLVANQVQFSLVHAGIIDEGIYFNRREAFGVLHTGGVLDYCREHQVTLQAYSALGRGAFCGEHAQEAYRPLAEEIKKMAAEKGVAEETIAVAWVLRHPAGIQPIIGSRTPSRIAAAAAAADMTLSREEWYRLYYKVDGKIQP